MRTKYGIVGILTVLTALLMVSTVSAVPYTQEQQYVEQQAIAQEQQDKIQEFMSSPTYTQMREIIDEYLSSEDQEYISTMVSQFLDETDIPLSDDPILDLLITIAEVVMLLLGHNLIGQTVAFLITSLAVLPYAIGVGGIFGAADVLALLFSILESINWEEVITMFGLLGAFIVALGFVVFALVVSIIGIPIGAVLMMGGVWITYVMEMFDYLFNNMVIIKNQALSQALIKQPIGETLNAFFLKQYGAKSAI